MIGPAELNSLSFYHSDGW